MNGDGGAADRKRLHGGVHPFYFLGAGVMILVSLLGPVWLVTAVQESGLTWSLLLYVAWTALGLTWTVGLFWVCSAVVDATGIRRRKGEDPSFIAWDEVTSIRIGVSDETFGLVELPVLDELLAGHARRLEPVVTCGLPPYRVRTVHLWELGRSSGRRGLAQVTKTVDDLRFRAGLDRAEHPSLAELRAELKELSREPATPPADYKPRRAWID